MKWIEKNPNIVTEEKVKMHQKKCLAVLNRSKDSEPINTAVLVLHYCCSNWKSAREEIYGLTANASLPLWSQGSSVQADSWEIHILAWFGRHDSRESRAWWANPFEEACRAPQVSKHNVNRIFQLLKGEGFRPFFFKTCQIHKLQTINRQATLSS